MINLPFENGDFLVTFIRIALPLIICLIILRLLQRAVTLTTGRLGLSQAVLHPVHTVARWIIVVATLLIVLQQAGVQVASLWSVISAVLALIAVGFVAVWSVLSNMLCAIMIIIFKPFQIEDEVEVIDSSLPGLKGRVHELGLVYTTVKVEGGEGEENFIVKVPNNIFFQKPIKVKAAKFNKQLRIPSLQNDKNL